MEVQCHYLPTKTNVRINSFRVNHKDISLIIKSLNSNKAHGTNKKDTNLR